MSKAPIMPPGWTKFANAQDEITYKKGYRLLLERDKTDPEGRWYFQVECERPDSETGLIGVGRGGKVYLSEHMPESELHRVAFGLFLSYETHECREFFQWKGRSIYGPHISSDALWEISETYDYRKQAPK